MHSTFKPLRLEHAPFPHTIGRGNREKTMSLTPGMRLGHYEILAPIGAGGMGEVYRGRDSKLKREVALKTLPDAFTRDADRVSRLQREAELLASLNHPHIAAVYDFADFEGARLLVMELVEGETLAARITSGRLPIEEALSIATQIAEALEAAHEKGITHRDLKPANIKLTPTGNVKVLDFGLAKMDARANPGNLTDSPTMMTASTPGVIMGTAAYMSPEQARGKGTDRASDIWAFGCVLYEMLAGRRVFDGEDTSEIIAGILKADPDWSYLPNETPQAVRHVLRRCLQKDQKLRLHDIADGRIEIEEARRSLQTDIAEAPGITLHRERFRSIAVLALGALLVVAALWVWRPRSSPSSTAEMRVDISTPPTTLPSLAISPDGQAVVFQALFEGQLRLWLRSLDSSGAMRPLPTGGTYPFWSPGGRSIGFISGGLLKTIDINSETLQTIVDLKISIPGGGGAWNRDDVILYSTGRSPILRISPKGGESVAVTQLEGTQTSHRFPQFLPDQRHFLFFVTSASPEVRGVYVGQLDTPQIRRIMDANGSALYVSGHLLFPREGKLLAQAFDPEALVLSGMPFQVADEIAVDAGLYTAVSASATDRIAFRAAFQNLRQLTWFDRLGKPIEKLADPEGGDTPRPSISHDGRVALTRITTGSGGNIDIWLLEKTGLGRFTLAEGSDSSAIWSPDSSRIVFTSNRKGVGDLYQGPSTQPGAEELLLSTDQGKSASDWSPDGRHILYQSSNPKTGSDIWALPVDANAKESGEPFVVVQTNSNSDETDGQFSPDGRLIAYRSNKSGRNEIYVQSFAGPGDKAVREWKISDGGGTLVKWPRQSKELFYLTLDGRVMAVMMPTTSGGASVQPGAPTELFDTRVGGIATDTFAVSPDGQRFLLRPPVDAATPPITVILNWKAKP
jgi:serine/threonine protein kinase/roadblock/LC7 domain-containing protein